MRITPSLLIIAACMVLAASCRYGDHRLYLLSDFESDADLDRVQWQCHTLFAISGEHATHGSRSLQLSLYPSDFPGMAYAPEDRNWARYTVLSLDIYNPQDEVVHLVMRIDDTHEFVDYRDSCMEVLQLKPGMNQVRIPLSSLMTAGTKRGLHLQSVHRCLLFMVSPGRKYVLFIDYVHLA